jgi:hypothetical protein
LIFISLVIIIYYVAGKHSRKKGVDMNKINKEEKKKKRKKEKENKPKVVQCRPRKYFIPLVTPSISCSES